MYPQGMDVNSYASDLLERYFLTDDYVVSAERLGTDLVVYIDEAQGFIKWVKRPKFIEATTEFLTLGMLTKLSESALEALGGSDAPCQLAFWLFAHLPDGRAACMAIGSTPLGPEASA